MRTLLLFLCIAIVACKPETEKQKQLAEVAIRQQLEDEAFKTNSTLEILDFKVVDIYKVSGHALDYQRRENLLKQVKLENELAELLGERIKLYAQQMNQFNYDRLQEKGNETGAEMQEHLEKSKQLLKQADSLNKVIYTVTKDSLYQAKVFLKSVTTHKGDTQNFMDTLYFILNPEMKVLPRN